MYMFEVGCLLEFFYLYYYCFGFIFVVNFLINLLRA